MYMAECANHRCRKPLTGANRHLLCWTCYREKHRREQDERAFHRGRLAAMRIEGYELPVLLDDLVRLTHPDLHKGRRKILAGEVTAKLLELRSEYV